MPINALANLNVKLGFIFDTKSLAAVEKSLQRTGDRLNRAARAAAETAGAAESGAELPVFG